MAQLTTRPNKNNIFWENEGPFADNLGDVLNTPENSVIPGYTGEGINIRTADPKFVNPTTEDGYDFSLASDSPYIDQGTTVTIPISTLINDE